MDKRLRYIFIWILLFYFVKQANIQVRPGAKKILQELDKYFENMVFTASHECYANAVCDYLDPGNKYISYRLYRDSCIKTK